MCRCVFPLCLCVNLLFAMDAYRELTAAAEKQLQHPDVDLPHCTPLLRLWHYPSFDSWISFLVYVPAPRYEHSVSSQVVEVIWNQPFDAVRFNDPMKGLAHGLSTTPTITIRQAPISPTQLASLTSSLQKITLPMELDRSIVLDGTILGLATFGMPAAMELTWYPNMEAWSVLTDWATEVRSLLTKFLETK